MRPIYLAKVKRFMAFPGGSVVKNLPANAGDTGLISGPGRSPEVRDGKMLQYFHLETSMDKRTWRATVHRLKKSQHKQSYL